MAVDERDPYTGYMTTGHEWNGIKELNTPVPRPVYFFLIVTALFAVIYWILMPAWPLGVTYTKGLLGNDQRTIVAESLKQAALERGVWTKREQGGHDQEEVDRPRHRRVQFLDAVPLMTGGHVAGIGIAFFYRHDRSL